MALPPPPLNIPPSAVTVRVSAIDSTLWLVGAPSEMMWSPAIPGFDRVRCGCWSILIEHPSGKKLLYDLGTRKDWEKLPPAIGVKGYMEAGILKELKVEKNVAEILTEGGVRLGDVEGVIWSHWHFDHTGDVATFPGSTKLIVGPGFKQNLMPGYPIDPRAQTLESDFEGREVEEVSFEGPHALSIGRFEALDFFGDGSFYILNSPGHAVGHLSALARTTSPSTGKSTFIHLCGDTAHHVGEIRPSPYLPLPSSISPSPVPHIHATECPGHIFNALLRNGSTTEPILEFRDPGAGQPVSEQDRKFQLVYDEDDLRDTILKDEELDGNDEVLTILAHDWSLKGVIPEWPESLNNWAESGIRTKALWKFLEDFREVVKT